MDHPIILSNQQIGTRLGELRKRKGLSQAELAKSIAISRPSLAQIEQGNRNIDGVELQKLAIELGFSIDDFLSAGFSVQKSLEFGSLEKTIAASALVIRAVCQCRSTNTVHGQAPHPRRPSRAGAGGHLRRQER